MKKILLVIAMLAVLSMTGCNKNENVEKNNVQEDQTDYFPKFYDVVYNTEIDFSDKIPEIINDGKSIVLDKSNIFSLNGFEGTIKSVDALKYEEYNEYHSIAILNTDGEVFFSNEIELTLDPIFEKIQIEEKIEALSHTYLYSNRFGAAFLLLTNKGEIFVIKEDDGIKVEKFNFETEKHYGKIFNDLVGVWKLDKSVTAEEFGDTYVLGDNLQFGEHGEVYFGVKTDRDGKYTIVPNENVIIVEYDGADNVKFVYSETTSELPSKLILKDDNNIKAVWIKENNSFSIDDLYGRWYISSAVNGKTAEKETDVEKIVGKQYGSNELFLELNSDGTFDDTFEKLINNNFTNNGTYEFFENFNHTGDSRVVLTYANGNDKLTTIMYFDSNLSIPYIGYGFINGYDVYLKKMQ